MGCEVMKVPTVHRSLGADGGGLDKIVGRSYTLGSAISANGACYWINFQKDI